MGHGSVAWWVMGHKMYNPLSALHRVANETSLNQMADSVDDEQYAKFANSVRQ